MKKIVLITLIFFTVLSCVNKTEKTDKTSQIDRITDSSVQPIRKTQISKLDVVGTWKAYLDGSRLPNNYIFHNDGTYEFDNNHSKWSISNNQLVFSNEYTNYTASIDGKNMKISGVSKAGNVKFEMDAFKVDVDELKKEFKNFGNDFFENHIFNSGTANQVSFSNGKVVISIENYYDGANKLYSIEGTYQIFSNNSIKINWKGNSISYLNTIGATCGGLQTVRQSHIFSDIMTFDKVKKSLEIINSFEQTFYNGTRCGNEEKTEMNYTGFNFTLSK